MAQHRDNGTERRHMIAQAIIGEIKRQSEQRRAEWDHPWIDTTLGTRNVVIEGTVDFEAIATVVDAKLFK